MFEFEQIPRDGLSQTKSRGDDEPKKKLVWIRDFKSPP